jgi:hypothetical protein
MPWELLAALDPAMSYDERQSMTLMDSRQVPWPKISAAPVCCSARDGTLSLFMNLSIGGRCRIRTLVI